MVNNIHFSPQFHYRKNLSKCPYPIITPWKGRTYSRNLVLFETVGRLFESYLVLFGVI